MSATTDVILAAACVWRFRPPHARRFWFVIASDSAGESVAVAGGTVVVVVVTVLGATATDNTGPILAFVGAVLVALIAAYTAGRRQARALEAESSRLAQQLEHDRELADLAAARSALDDAALALHRVGELPESDLLEDGYDDRIEAVTEGEVASAASRLTIRFGPEHPVVQAFGACQDQLTEWLLHAVYVAAPEDTNVSEAQRLEAVKGLDAAVDAFSETSVQFLETAAKTAAARLP